MKKQETKYIKLKEEFNPATQKYEPVLPLTNNKQDSKTVEFKIPNWWPLLLAVFILLIAHFILMFRFEGNSNLQMMITTIMGAIMIILLSIITYISMKKNIK